MLSAYRLAAAWQAAALVLLRLAAGVVCAGKYDVASDSCMYLVLSLGGLLASRFDRWELGKSAAPAIEDSRGALGASRAELGR